MRTTVLILACALSLGACVTTHHYAVAPPGPPYAGPVAIYLVGATPKGEFTEVAVVQAELSQRLFHDPSVEDVLPLLQARAAKLGCDALLHVRIDKGSSHITATGMAARSASLPQP
jgi:hypothetical protein